MISDKSTNDDSITDMTTSENSQMYKSKIEKKAVKCYSCKDCGNTFDANPPDDVHKSSSVFPCWKFDWVERSYQCSRCSKKNIKLFWHAEVHKHHDYATVDEVERKTGKKPLSNRLDYMRRMVGY